MDCDLCYKEFNKHKQPICASCAQTALYHARIRHATAMLGREKAHNHVEAILRPSNDGVLAALSEDTDLEAIAGETQRQGYVQSRAKLEAIRPKIDEISASSQQLREEIEQYKEYRTRRKDQVASRRTGLQNARRQLELEKARAREPILAAIAKTEARLDKVHVRTSEARLFLCHQLAMLLDFKRVKKDAEAPSEYWLAGSPIPNLRHLCRPTQNRGRTLSAHLTNPHEAVTASFENVCRLLVLCCHYLSVRLPAEIIIPASGVVRYTILPERSSYQNHDLVTNPNNISASTRSLGRQGTDRANVSSRSRTLHLDRSLQTLSNENVKEFQLFIESVMLLGWDIAWLSRTQGTDIVNTFEEVCAIGRNLYNLFVRNASLPKRRPASSRLHSTESVATATVTPANTSELQFGGASHGSVYRAIHSAQGQLLINSWRFGTPAAATRLIDKLANYLVAEMSRQEWDTIDEHEWDDEREDEQAVLVGGSRVPTTGLNETAMSIMTVRGARDDSERSQKGQSGWMKVRGR